MFTLLKYRFMTSFMIMCVSWSGSGKDVKVMVSGNGKFVF